MAEISKVIGLMSGTSLDGVDAALIETDGEDVARPLASLTIPYSPETRALLRAALEEARNVEQGAPIPYAIRDAERLLTEPPHHYEIGGPEHGSHPTAAGCRTAPGGQPAATSRDGDQQTKRDAFHQTENHLIAGDGIA